MSKIPGYTLIFQFCFGSSTAFYATLPIRRFRDPRNHVFVHVHPVFRPQQTYVCARPSDYRRLVVKTSNVSENFENDGF